MSFSANQIDKSRSMEADTGPDNQGATQSEVGIELDRIQSSTTILEEYTTALIDKLAWCSNCDPLSENPEEQDKKPSSALALKIFEQRQRIENVATIINDQLKRLAV